MVVCKFFLEGNCRFGDRCRNEHPGAQNTGFGSVGQNRFGALQNQNIGGRNDGDGRKDTSWNILTSDIKNDLSEGKGRPQWILSTYGPGRNAPASLLEGNEYSPEEVRWRFYEQAAKGNKAQADQEAIALWNNCSNAMKDVVSNADNVVKFMEISDKKHPNRYDFIKMNGSKTRDEVTQEAESHSSTRFGGASNAGFGAGNAFKQASNVSDPFSKPAASTFGQPAQSTGFGSSTFGQPSQPAAFGASNAFGKPAFGSTGFGQASSFGQPAQPTSAFGQTSQPSSTFGKPAAAPAFGASGFGQNATASPFAAPSAAGGFGQIAQSNPFGKPAQSNKAFGQPSPPVSSFGQPSQPAASFGQSTGLGQATAFSKPTFGQASQPTADPFNQASQPASNPFNNTSQPTANAFGQNNQTSSFGQPTQTSSTPFAQPPTSNGFGASSAPTFGATTSPSNPFSQPPTSGSSNPGPNPNPFGVKPAISSGFGQPNQQSTSSSLFGQTSQTLPTATAANPFARKASDSAEAAAVSATELTNAIAALSAGGPNPLTNAPTHPVTYAQTLPRAPPTCDASNKLTSFRGQRVKYVDQVPVISKPGEMLEKVWFPKGPVATEVMVTCQGGKEEEYQGGEGEYTDDVKEGWRALFENGRFGVGGKGMPLVPPRREWCLFDF